MCMRKSSKLLERPKALFTTTEFEKTIVNVAKAEKKSNDDIWLNPKYQING